MSAKHYLTYVNDRCNMNCPYCYDSRKRTGEEMPDAVIDACLDFYRRTAGDEALSIMFLGGEPSLSPHVLRRFLEGAGESWFFELMTNAFNWQPDFLDMLRPYRKRLTIIASYDGMFQERRKPGSTERVLGNIRMAISRGFMVVPCWTTTDETVGSLFENARKLIADTAGFRRLFIKRNCLHNIWGNNAAYLQGLAANIDRYAALLAHERIVRGQYVQTLNRIETGSDLNCVHRKGTFSCQTGFPSQVVVGMDGALYPCELYASNHRHPIGDVWKGHDMDALRAMSAPDYAGAARRNNVCPWWNETRNGDWRDCSGCINDEADNMLFAARGKIQDHLDRLGRLKAAFGGGHV